MGVLPLPIDKIVILFMPLPSRRNDLLLTNIFNIIHKLFALRGGGNIKIPQVRPPPPPAFFGDQT